MRQKVESLPFLKRLSSRNFFARFPLKNKLIDLKTSLTKFELSTTFSYRYKNSLHFPLKSLFCREILPGLPIKNKISKSYCRFLILDKCFTAELLSMDSKESELQIICFSSKCKLAFRKLIFCRNTEKMATLSKE